MVTFAGCTKEEIKTPVSETRTVQFVAESIETKTAFGTPDGTPDGTTYPTLWTENDEQVHVSMNLTSSKPYDITPSDDFKTARFEAEIADDESGSYTFYSVSPASANINFSSSFKSYNLEIPTTQTPSATSVDEKAQILVAASETYNEFPNSVNLAYTHFTAYGKMSLTNLNLDGAVVSSVAITASKNIAYRYYYYPASGTSEENGATSTITIMTSSVSDIWFACAPVDMSNSTMKVVVNTDKGTFTREVTFPADRVFEAGKISIFSVNMAGISLESPEVYELVTDSAELTEGSKVIIVGDTYAMGTNQKNSNRAAEAVALSDDKTTISTPGATVQIFTIEEGTKAGTVAFNTGSGYIYAASSSSNSLKTQDDLDDNASWIVTISEGVTSVVAQGTNTRNTMRYNPNNGSPLFNCYASTSTTGSTVSIYKLQGSGTVLENYMKVSEENIEVEADATSASFTVKSDLEWTATSEDASDVTSEGNTVTVTFPANEEAEEQVYTVTVSADGVDPVTVTITQKGYVDTSVIEGLTVAEFKNKEVSTEVWYRLTGTISNIYNTQYGNFYLTDEAGDQITVYGLKENESAGNQSFANLGLKEGDKVTLIGNVGEYNSNKQVVNAYHVSSEKLAAWDAPEIVCSNNKVTITAEAGVSVYYTTNGETPSLSSTLYGEAFEINSSTTVMAIAVADGRPQSTVAEKLCEYVDLSDQPATVDATLTLDDKEKRTSYSTSQQVWTENGITLTNDKGISTSNVGDYAKPARFYKSSKITVEAPGKITQIVFDCNSSSYATALKNSITSGGTVTVSSDKVTVVLTTPAESFVISSLTGGQVRMDGLTVTYQN